MPFKLGVEPQLRPETGTQDIHDAFRLAFWMKDHWVGRLEHQARINHPIALGFARAAELLLLDVPVAAYATVLPHELFGHGGRLREFGGSATYQFELPPPYSFKPSFTHTKRPLAVDTADTHLLFSQAGILVEGYEAHAALVSSVEADTLNHIDSGLIVGVSIHEIFEATLPWSSNDVRTWTSMQARRYLTSARPIQREYLVATSIAALVNPTILYSFYDLFWRFLVLGKRTGPMPSVHVGTAALWATDHVSPVPWGLEYELGVLGRWPGGTVLEVSPRWGHGLAGRSLGIKLDMMGLRVVPDLPNLVAAAGIDLWFQPELDIEATTIFGSSPSNTPGARGHAEVRWEQPGWFVGLRLGAKTKGLSGLQPIASSAETVVYVGLLLGRP
ncbi:hypothetical protein BH11GEM2_BH11GEM2_36930 [soil metagenome]